MYDPATNEALSPQYDSTKKQSLHQSVCLQNIILLRDQQGGQEGEVFQLPKCPLHCLHVAVLSPWQLVLFTSIFLSSFFFFSSTFALFSSSICLSSFCAFMLLISVTICSLIFFICPM